jgi:hypothetical protein
MSSQVGVQVIVDERGIGFQGFLQAYHGPQWFEFHHDVVEGIFGNVAALGEDHGERLTCEADLVFDQGNLGA